MIGFIADIITIGEKFPEIIKKIKKLNDGFYYKNYEKEVFIHENGHVIIAHSFTIAITDSNRCDKIYRDIDVSDDTNIFKFDKLDDLIKTDISKRYSEAGFWYSSENNLLKAVEFPWDEDDREKRKHKILPQQLKWYFEIDKTKIINGKDYNFKYAASIPNMLPITDGKYDKTKETSPDYSFISMLSIDNEVKNCKYVLSFDKKIEISQFPICAYYTKGGGKRKLLTCQFESGLFYDNYITKCKILKKNNNIEYKWNIR